MSCIFGPVPSRRLGRSLGVDIVPFKICSYDCIYCQLGRTTDKTIERKKWNDLDVILEELKTKLSTKPDYITLSGSGEPTLYSELENLIKGIKELTDIPVAVLTNGSLFWKEDVRRSLLNADLVIPSLDAGDKSTFNAVNRPAKGITFEKMLQGLIDFRKEFQGQMWLEICLVAGYTAINAEINKLVKAADQIKPDRIQLNTVSRPPAENYAVGVSQTVLTEFAQKFNPIAEVIVDFNKTHDLQEFSASRENIFGLLQRRPCSVEDIANGLSIHQNEVIKFIEDLLSKKQVEQIMQGDTLYYKVAH